MSARPWRTVETSFCQRWSERRGSYRPAREVVDLRRYEVVKDATDALTKDFVVRHHYSGSFPSARFRFRVVDVDTEQTVGAIVYSHPTNDAVFSGLPGERGQQVELGRLVLIDEVPANAETAFVAESMRRIHREDGVESVISFSDPVARTDVGGRMVMPGHIGTVYQGLNGWFTGRATGRTLSLLPDGSVLSPRAIQKVRSRERGQQVRGAADPCRWAGRGCLRG